MTWLPSEVVVTSAAKAFNNLSTLNVTLILVSNQIILAAETSPAKTIKCVKVDDHLVAVGILLVVPAVVVKTAILALVSSHVLLEV